MICNAVEEVLRGRISFDNIPRVKDTGSLPTDKEELEAFKEQQISKVMENEEGLETENQTSAAYFLILTFDNLPKFQGLLFSVFLVLYLMSLLANLLITILVCTDQRLHKPMYFFLLNLSVIDMSYTSVTIPKMLAILHTQSYTISVTGCALQVYFFLSLVSVEFYLLTTMSYDRFVAICFPLRYVVIMNKKICMVLVAVCWAAGFTDTLPEPAFVFLSSFCQSNRIDHFFCDPGPLVKLSCTSTYIIEIAMFVQSLIFGFVPFSITLTSYVFIIWTILKIRSTEGRRKAFSTCSSHLIVVTLFYGTALFLYMRPRSGFSTDINKLLTVLYVTLMPLLNPIIYSLRNKELKDALKKEKVVADCLSLLAVEAGSGIEEKVQEEEMVVANIEQGALSEEPWLVAERGDLVLGKVKEWTVEGWPCKDEIEKKCDRLYERLMERAEVYG
ncbi:olfactory receptor 10A3-like [Ambystoma mexicanum]|uniref:olfactory receptor 10A3-like n=1 Tax=Ambystoma mexicanum TaxID=8296 RepID=UPI0037E87882